MAETQSNENTCVVCFKNVLYYSVGECDHPVCFECSTRMRVLCVQNECPICRQDLSRVVFTEYIQPYKELRNRAIPDRLFERQYKIGFCSEEIKHAYERLLENRCKICDKLPPFRTFSMLNDHMRKVHERYFCDLCVKHLKIFTNERKCYTRQELGHHRRKGDLDDTSHRGHPLCKFCEERFMDADELYRHMRKEHLYCHLCDADGSNQYYSSHAELARHFRDDHYLCEEGECADQHLTSVFRSDIDLKAHKATVHGRGMARGAARQARTLELQFNITPHAALQRNNRERVETPSSESGGAASRGSAVTQAHIDTRSDEQFPRLSAAPAPHNLMLTAPTKTYRGSEGLARNDRNFPALDGAGAGGGGAGGGGAGGVSRAAPPATVAATIVRNTKPSVSIQLHSQPASASNFRLTQTSGARISIPPRAPPRAPPPRRPAPPLDDDDFPSLGPAPRDDHPNIGASTVQPPKVAVINSQEMQALKSNQSASQHKKPQLSSEAFPALSSASAPAAPPQWITVSKAKEKNKPVRHEPPPQPRETAFNAVADFPTLPVNNSKVKTKKTIQTAAQPPPKPAYNHTETKPSKKEKKKQNSNKKENLTEDITREIPLVNGLDKRYARDPSYTEVNVNNNQTVERDKKIKTIETSSTVTVNTVNPEKNRNGGNGDFALAARDYPPLNPRSDAESHPPPGSWIEAGAAPNKKPPNGSVPPGFKPRPPCDGMTFTNSSGQTFSAPVHEYIPPPEFERRNRALVGEFAAALGGVHALDEFKHASRAFREGLLAADRFTAHCRAALADRLDDVFPELVALLPDIRKQQELALGRALPLHVCAVCGQLLAPPDRPAHDAKHWPPLASR